MAREFFGFVIAGVTGAVVAFVVMMLLGSTWREAMPVSTLVGLVLPFVTYYVIQKSKKNRP